MTLTAGEELPQLRDNEVIARRLVEKKGLARVLQRAPVEGGRQGAQGFQVAWIAG